MGDVVKDALSAKGYISKSLKLRQYEPWKFWEIGFSSFLGMYSIGTMFFPLLAYAVMFGAVLKEHKALKSWYLKLSISILSTPFVAPIR